jgi:hypothetical protein
MDEKYNIELKTPEDYETEFNSSMYILIDINKRLNTINLHEASTEFKKYQLLRSLKLGLINLIIELRVKLSDVYKIVWIKVNNVKLNNQILITNEKNLSSINSIITNLENNMDHMDINELYAHFKWIPNIDKELKTILGKLIYYREKLYNNYINNIADVWWKLEAEEKDKMEDYKLNEYHSLINQIMDEMSQNQTYELQVVIDNQKKPILKLENYTQKKINHGIAQISEIVTTKKIKKTVIYKVDVWKYEAETFSCECHENQKKNIMCRHICFLVCSLAEIVVLRFFKYKRLTENELIQFYDKIKSLVYKKELALKLKEQ